MSDHTTPADQPSLRADIDTQDFRNRLLRTLVAYADGCDYDEARAALVAHINAHTTRAVEAAVAAAQPKEKA